MTDNEYGHEIYERWMNGEFEPESIYIHEKIEVSKIPNYSEDLLIDLEKQLNRLEWNEVEVCEYKGYVHINADGDEQTALDTDGAIDGWNAVYNEKTFEYDEASFKISIIK